MPQGGDEIWEPVGRCGMLLSRGHTHRFLRTTFRRPTWCDWCRQFLWGLGKQGLRCVECKFVVHKQCEEQLLRSNDQAKKTCKNCKGSGGDRPVFRFKVKIKSGSDALLEVDPNSVVPMLTLYQGKDRHQVQCAGVVVEKPNYSNRHLHLRYPDGSETKLHFATRREREQLAACLAFLSQRAGQKLTFTPIRIWVGTWNMGDAPPPDPSRSSQSIADWLKPDENYDIICACVQECEYKPRHGFSSCEEDWFNTVESVLGKRYVRVVGESMWSIRVIVFVRADRKDHVTQVNKKTEATGVARVAGNKGGVCIAFNYMETRLCFVGSHLAAHQNKVAARNRDFFEIVSGCTGLGWKGFSLTDEFHHVFWSGDLNYRINYERSKVVQLSYQGPDGWNELYKRDQLAEEMRKENVFIDFNESQPYFQPSYKYAIGENIYPDDEKMRIPSWCDRVLWKSLSNEGIVQEDYTSVQSVMTSDHRPVYSVFRIQARNQFIPDSIVQPLTAPASEFQTEHLDSSPTSYIVIRQLAGHDLDSADANGYSDPYIVFVSPILQNSYSTKVQTKTLNPAWEDEQVPHLRVNFEELEYLESEYLWLSVYDWDRASQDDPIGQAHLALIGLMDGRTHSFCVRTLREGKVAGTLTGTLQYIAAP